MLRNFAAGRRARSVLTMASFVRDERNEMWQGDSGPRYCTKKAAEEAFDDDDDDDDNDEAWLWACV